MEISMHITVTKHRPLEYLCNEEP